MSCSGDGAALAGLSLCAASIRVTSFSLNIFYNLGLPTNKIPTSLNSIDPSSVHLKRPIMADRKAPYIPQDPQEINSLIHSLDALTGRGRGKASVSVKKHTFDLPGGGTVDSWRMQDWDYKKEHLPTYARGLFTRRNARSGNYEIVARGYDKFFNHGEVQKDGMAQRSEEHEGGLTSSASRRTAASFSSPGWTTTRSSCAASTPPASGVMWKNPIQRREKNGSYDTWRASEKPRRSWPNACER